MLRKFSSPNRVIALWNSLPDIVVQAVNSDKRRLTDSGMTRTSVKYNWKAGIGIGIARGQYWLLGAFLVIVLTISITTEC